MIAALISVPLSNRRQDLPICVQSFVVYKKTQLRVCVLSQAYGPLVHQGTVGGGPGRHPWGDPGGATWGPPKGPGTQSPEYLGTLGGPWGPKGHTLPKPYA